MLRDQTSDRKATGVTQLRFLISNPTCLSLLDRHREWLQSLGVEVVTDVATLARSRRQIEVACDAIIGPASWALRLDDGPRPEAQRLRVISLASSGHEWVDVPSATRHGIVVTYAPIATLGEVVADHTLGLLLAVARQIPGHHVRLQRGDATRGMGTLVWGRTLGILGLGNIGKKVAQRAHGFEMHVLAVDTCPDRDFCDRHGVKVVDLDTLLEQSDFVSLHLRLDATTRGCIGARELGRMKPTAYLINTARAELIDEDALVEAILRGRIAGAALDDAPRGAARRLLHRPNVVFTPHIGNRVLESADAVCRQAYTNALAILQGRMPELRYVLNPEMLAGGQIPRSSA
jgi:phosphoglycerate dehydrogenase-like enzyme